MRVGAATGPIVRAVHLNGAPRAKQRLYPRDFARL
ncbi:hypothetical protein PFLmoz3_02769 [Pseudomonas fluorescens]|uniref:Uncharacterized protein n=1 Tax=Pseudomonas fluorescens TaxID=294 RepID=A0A109LH00_PSEFL|nr:hypothetical protein PFLmoz3_02769 [Pseudomonas fluorescens]